MDTGLVAAPSPSPPPSPLLPVKGDGLLPGSLGTAGFRERQEKGAMDMQGLPAATEGQPGLRPPGPAPEGRRWRAGGWSERGRALRPHVPAPPPGQANVQTRTRVAGHPGPHGGPGEAEGTPPSPSCSPRSWSSHRRLVGCAEAPGPGSRPCNHRAHRARTLCPCASRCPPARRAAPILGPREGTDPASSPTRWFGRLWQEWAVEWGREPGPEPHGGTGSIVYAAWRAACPARQDASQLRLSTRGPGRLCLGRGCRCAARRCG